MQGPVTTFKSNNDCDMQKKWHAEKFRRYKSELIKKYLNIMCNPGLTMVRSNNVRGLVYLKLKHKPQDVCDL